MPLYEYHCAACGTFELLRPLGECAEPGTCPACAGAAPRRLSSPHIAAPHRPTYQAHARNEQARHAPRHACADHRPQRQERPSRPARPWMLGH